MPFTCCVYFGNFCDMLCRYRQYICSVEVWCWHDCLQVGFRDIFAENCECVAIKISEILNVSVKRRGCLAWHVCELLTPAVCLPWSVNMEAEMKCKLHHVHALFTEVVCSARDTTVVFFLIGFVVIKKLNGTIPASTSVQSLVFAEEAVGRLINVLQWCCWVS